MHSVCSRSSLIQLLSLHSIVGECGDIASNWLNLTLRLFCLQCLMPLQFLNEDNSGAWGDTSSCAQCFMPSLSIIGWVV